MQLMRQTAIVAILLLGTKFSQATCPNDARLVPIPAGPVLASIALGLPLFMSGSKFYDLAKDAENSRPVFTSILGLFANVAAIQIVSTVPVSISNKKRVWVFGVANAAGYLGNAMAFGAFQESSESSYVDKSVDGYVGGLFAYLAVVRFWHCADS